MQINQEIINAYEDWWEKKNTDALIFTSNWPEAPDHASYKKDWMYQNLEANWALAQALEIGFKQNSLQPVKDIIPWMKELLTREKFTKQGFPNFFFNMGPGSTAATISGFNQFHQNTIWFENQKMPYKDIIALDARQRSDYAEFALKAAELVAEELKDYAILSLPDLGGIIDILASLRTTNGLLMEVLLTDPELMHNSLKKIEEIWLEDFKAYESVFIKKNNGLYTSWMPIISTKSAYPFQADFGAMISPDLFETYVFPSLRRQCEQIDRPIFHLDGKEMIQHIDFILQIDKLKAVQWTSGDGNEPLDHERWYPLYEKIVKADKNIILLGFPQQSMEKLFKHFPARHFYLMV